MATQQYPASPQIKIPLSGPGLYTVQAGNSQGCFSASSPAYSFVVMGLGQEAPGTAFTAFPNPTSGSLQLASTTLPADFELTLVNSVGKVVDVQQVRHFRGSQVIELKNFAPGLYILHLRTNKERLSKKIMLQ